jgi:hypothetical protein
MRILLVLYMIFLPFVLFAQKVGSSNTLEISTSSGVTFVYYNSQDCSSSILKIAKNM